MPTHTLGIVVSLVAGLLMIAPNLIFMNSSGYAGLPMMPTDWETYYVSRIHAAYEGCIFNCHPYLRDVGTSYPLTDAGWWMAILAFPGKMFGLSVLTLHLIYQFALPSLLTFLFYLLIWRLTKDVRASVIGSLFIILGFNLFNAHNLIDVGELFNVVQLKIPTAAAPLPYLRPVNPQFSSTVFALFLHLLLSCFERRTWRRFTLLALIFSLSFYIYFYLWSFLAAGIVACAIFFSIKRDFRAAAGFMAALAAGLLAGSPILLNLYRIMHHPYYPFMHQQVTSTSRFHPDAAGLILFAIFLAAAWLYVRRVKSPPPGAYLLACLVAAGFVLVQQHVFTGSALQNFHYYDYYLTPLLVIALSCALAAALKKYVPHKAYALPLLIICLTAVNAILIQTSVYRQNFPAAYRVQQYVPALTWIKDHIPATATIAAPEPVGHLIPLYSHAGLLWSRYAILYLHDPARPNDAARMFESFTDLEEIARKYRAAYVIQETQHDLLAASSYPEMYRDAALVIYKVPESSSPPRDDG